VVWFLVFSNSLDTECYTSSTAMLPGPAIPILSQVFFVMLKSKENFVIAQSNFDKCC
jgi:hypothetical protein